MFYRNTAYKHHQTMTHPPLPKQNATGQTKAGINEEEFPKATHSSLPSSRATLNQLSHPPQKRCSRFQRGAHTGACAGRQAARGEEPRTARRTFNSCTGTKTKRGTGVRECPQDTRLWGAGLVRMHTFGVRRVPWKKPRQAHGTGVWSGSLGGWEWGGRWTLSYIPLYLIIWGP